MCWLSQPKHPTNSYNESNHHYHPLTELIRNFRNHFQYPCLCQYSESSFHSKDGLDLSQKQMTDSATTLHHRIYHNFSTTFIQSLSCHLSTKMLKCLNKAQIVSNYKTCNLLVNFEIWAVANGGKKNTEIQTKCGEKENKKLVNVTF